MKHPQTEFNSVNVRLMTNPAHTVGDADKSTITHPGTLAEGRVAFHTLTIQAMTSRAVHPLQQDLASTAVKDSLFSFEEEEKKAPYGMVKSQDLKSLPHFHIRASRQCLFKGSMLARLHLITIP